MGYGAGALDQLATLLGRLPPGAGILELGAQDINADVPHDRIVSCLQVIYGRPLPFETVALFNREGPWKVAELFRNSNYKYRCIDLFPGDFTIVADLNTLQVAQADRGKFQLVTNHGTTEHVADQINSFRAVHDFAGVGATMIHAVPFSGYFDHGLYNYHPLFFVFLAHANEYEIEHLALSAPHLSYTIPTDYAGTDAWSGRVVQSGIVGCLLRKVNDAPFRLFTDFDQATMGRLQLSEPWSSIVRDRYDLRIR